MSSDNPISYRCSQLSNYDLSVACSSVNRYYYDAAPFLLSKPANPTSKMLHKTGFRFKRLMSPRKNQIDEGEMPSSSDPSPNSKQNQYQNSTESQPSKLRVKSWVSRPSGENEQFSQDENPPSKKSTSSTAHSSSSSLCSCDSTMACAGPHSLSRSTAPAQAPSTPPKSAPTDPQTSTSLEILPLDVTASSSSQSDTDARTWRLILSDLAIQTPLIPFRKSTDKVEGKRPHNSTFNLLEALAIDPVSDKDKTPTPSLNLSPKSLQDSISFVMNLSPTSISSTTPTEIEALARQTDEAFRAVGNALEEAKATTQLFTKASSSSSASPAPFMLAKKQRKAPIARTKSRAKRTKSSRKKKVEGKREARWTMSVTEVTDNVADIFKGRIFKNDVEELIDTSKLGQGQRLSAPVPVTFSTSPKQSGETARSTSTTSTGPTPDPFVLDSLPIRLTASGLSSQSQPPPSNDKSIKPTEEPTTKKDEIAPPIPVKNRRRHDSAISITTPPARTPSNTLASIPELSPMSPLDMHLDAANFFPTPIDPPSPPAIPRKSSHRNPRPDPLPLRSDELPSTPFTLWSHWQQGGIRLLRDRNVRQRLRVCSDVSTLRDGGANPRASEVGFGDGVSPDDVMDLSVFQMAICVGENEPPVDNENAVDELCGWVAELGVAVGGVVSEVEDARRRAVERLARRREERRVRAEEIRGRGLRRTVVEIDGREVEGRPGREADESLPPSPLVDVRGGVPMGFNLGHDLDDYLKWERGVVERFAEE